MALWKINCMEAKYPGLWHQWYRHQCVAVGWSHHWGCKLRGKTKEGPDGWYTARAALLRIAVGDHIVVALKGNRVGRVGQVTEKHIEDHEWNPLVPVSKHLPRGQMGRRIYVRWDLACGPDQRSIVSLPKGRRFTSGELRPTLAEIRSQTIKKLKRSMNDQRNWVGLLDHFKYEGALSDYIATYPHHLEDGLVPYPNSKVREKVFPDRKRLDVLLLDRKEQPVIVECKQDAPTLKYIEQLRHYMRSLQEETGRKYVRGILVHGGSRNLDHEVVEAAKRAPVVEIVQYQLQVDFTGGSAG